MTKHTSSTQAVPLVTAIPRHIAMIMDGNGRWAKKRLLPRVAGHKRGVETVRAMVQACADLGVSYLTLFAFSSENWRRPDDEVGFLMKLFVRALQSEARRMHENGICLRVIGDLSRFAPELQDLIAETEALTADNQRLTVTIAANYGGRWDMLQAFQRWLEEGAAQPHGERPALTESSLAEYLQMAYAPEPDLFIRTGGEQRISNFLLWQLAYTELYFTDVLWPDFDRPALEQAIAWYGQRERRFGRTSEQLTRA